MLAKQNAAFLHRNLSKLHLSLSRLSIRVVPEPDTESAAARDKRDSRLAVYCNTQITKHGKDGDIGAAESVFSRMPFKTTVSWTAMLTAYAENGQIEKALQVFDEMPERTTASYNAMITAYIRNCVDVNKAFQLFYKIPDPNAVSYAAMVTGLVQAGMVDMAKKLHSETPFMWRDPVCSNALLNGYLKMGALDEAVRVFESMEQRNVVSFSSMIDGYCKKGAVLKARELFDKMPEQNVITWTAMINGYLQMGLFEDGFMLFLDMRREGVVGVNSTTLTVIVEACTDSERFHEGEQMHGLVFLLGFQSDVFLGNSTINMYCRFSSVEAANKIFQALSRKDVVTWNSLIAGYAQSGDVEEAYRLFQRMPTKDVVSWTTMITGFSASGMTEKSIKLFEMMPIKDGIAWTAIISSLVNNEEYEEAFRCFIKMLRTAVRPNPLTLSSVLRGSSGLAALNQGLQVHAFAVKMELEYDTSIRNSLISMYSKCGNMMDAYKIFIGISAPNVVSYNSIITGLAQNGFGEKALRLFKKMENEGQCPNQVTFLAVLSACCHAGLVKEGWDHFKSMKSRYGMEPKGDHYACLVDLLGRAGLLEEAVCLIRSMPSEPHGGVWGALLSASKTHSRLDLAELAAGNLMKLQPDDATPYVVLSSLYDASEKKYEGNRVRMAQKSKGLRKSPGCSWIIVKENVHRFLAGDKSHPDIEEIEFTLCAIGKDMQVRPVEFQD
ncbi:pentatricopeptide repeat-containing protein At1g53600, mitochondrial isoform X1 [Punica granatum]|uniref:Pentatricopeptide repeat-containing protein At1g53600, mitochondrial isoform X1 n=1 Tax=Punica granatum TaxID=22663 RepID=A0A218XUS8_PUNGR|nr:pentatricopeptide repeat-containing protein At1g53600, mitochondrial isoform X1 [Punica granatum]OWM88548.1 hypothetical protein CDL15_Pgr002315 [Punica granatum]